MTGREVRETLEKQLQLLSERSKACVTNRELAELTTEMLKIAEFLLTDGPKAIPVEYPVKTIRKSVDSAIHGTAGEASNS